MQLPQPQQRTVRVGHLATNRSEFARIKQKMKIDLNHSTQQELRKLPGIGLVLAQRIVDLRPFNNTTDLQHKVHMLGKRVVASWSNNPKFQVVVKREPSGSDSSKVPASTRDHYRSLKLQVLSITALVVLIVACSISNIEFVVINLDCLQDSDCGVDERCLPEKTRAFPINKQIKTISRFGVDIVVDGSLLSRLIKQHQLELGRICKSTKQGELEPDYLSENYRIIERLGSGSYGSISRVLHKQSNNTYALKMMSKALDKHMQQRRFDNEVHVLKRLGKHSNVVSFIESFETEQAFVIVTELCTEGTLAQHVSAAWVLSEQESATIFRDVLQGLKHLHDHDFVHGDICNENLMLTEVDGRWVVKIIDFGSSQYINASRVDARVTGWIRDLGRSTSAPEISSRQMTWGMLFKSDMFTLVNCIVPTVSGLQPPNLGLSSLYHDFIARLLERNVTRRMSCEEALQHEWIEQYAVQQAANRSIVELRQRQKGVAVFGIRMTPILFQLFSVLSWLLCISVAGCVFSIVNKLLLYFNFDF